MIVIKLAAEILDFSTDASSSGKKIGFVPTMGALHDGHISLIRKAKQENKIVVVSVFVNPTQFNDKKDLQKYPRTFEVDKAILEGENVDVMFYPNVSEIYPDSDKAIYELDGLDNYMEGPNRPGHFNGVGQVVTRLFDLIKPTHAYFGEKDFQQLTIIRHMTNKLGYNVMVKDCPTMRETDGLAMSSRNVRLSAEARDVAAEIYKELVLLRESFKLNGLKKSLRDCKERISNTEGMELEYLELVDPINLEPIKNDKHDAVQACVAVELGGVRLIDNLRVK